MDILKELSEQVERGKINETEELTKKALDEGIEPKKILDDGLIVGMKEIGDKFKRNEAFVPEMLIAARAMNKALEVLEPILLENKVEAKGKVLIGTVKGDLHDIGKNLVGIMLKGAGYDIIDIGIDVPPEKFVAAAKENNVHVVGLSALLTTTMVNMKDVVTRFKSAGMDTKIVIGGAPITQQFADEISADGYAPDAASAVDVVQSLMN